MQKSFCDLEYAAKKKLTRRDRFLAKIGEVTPWSQLHQLIEPFYPKAEGAGRPPVGLARMLRMYVAQQCFGLSDEGIEDAIYDSQAIRGFVGIDLNRESAPDATTLLKFRRLLENNELTRRIFETINGHLATKGLMMREGTIVTASANAKRYSMFCACSRICSIKSFRSIAARVISRLAAFDPSVLASRFISWNRKSNRLPALPLGRFVAGFAAF
jgi:transposase